MTTRDDVRANQAALAPVIGGRIVYMTIGDAGFLALLVERGTRRWWLDIQADPEGNGPGFVNVVVCDEHGPMVLQPQPRPA